MKQRIRTGIVLALAVLLTGCGGKTPETAPSSEAETPPEETVVENGMPEREEITMERLAAANRAAALLDRHGSFLLNVHTEFGGEAIDWEAYTENHLTYVQYEQDPENTAPGDTAACLFTEDGDACYIGDETGLVFSVFLYAVPEEDRERMTIADCELLDPELTVQETITGVEESDTAAVIHTELDGNTVTYTVDPETLELRSMDESSYLTPDTVMTIRTELETDAARPALAEEMYTLLQGALAVDDTRTVTIITDPGQDGEETYSMTLRKGVGISPVLGENYTLCQRTETGMIPFVPEANSAEMDLTLYAIQQEA